MNFGENKRKFSTKLQMLKQGWEYSFMIEAVTEKSLSEEVSAWEEEEKGMAWGPHLCWTSELLSVTTVEAEVWRGGGVSMGRGQETLKVRTHPIHLCVDPRN